MTIRIIENAHLEGYEDAFYRFTTTDGKKSAMGIWNNWYEAIAEDEDGNGYRIVWEISNYDAFNQGDEDCCDWDAPAEVINMETGAVVTKDATIIW